MTFKSFKWRVNTPSSLKCLVTCRFQFMSPKCDRT